MCVWHLRHFDLVHTFVSEQKRQYHSFRPSTATALARSSSIRTCFAIHLLFFCVCHPSPFERSSAPIEWVKFDETAAVNTTNNKTQKKSPKSRSGHKSTQTPWEQKRLEPKWHEQDFAPSLQVFAINDPFLGPNVLQNVTGHDIQSDPPCTREVHSRFKQPNETATILTGTFLESFFGARFLWALSGRKDRSSRNVQRVRAFNCAMLPCSFFGLAKKKKVFCCRCPCPLYLGQSPRAFCDALFSFVFMCLETVAWWHMSQ